VAGGQAEAEARWVAGTQVGSGGDGHMGHGSVDLSRVRERGAGARDVFLDKAITSVSHP
jgi:hypothetical protein